MMLILIRLRLFFCKPLQGLWGGTRRTFIVFNVKVRHNFIVFNVKVRRNFNVNLNFNVKVQRNFNVNIQKHNFALLESSQWKPIPGDEQIMYEDLNRSKQDSTQKHFYLQGLHSKSGRYTRAIDHLIFHYDSLSKDDHDKTPKTSNRNVTLSKVDFPYKIQLTNTNDQRDDSDIDEENQFRDSSDNEYFPIFLPREIQNIIKLVHLLEDYTILIDGNYSSDNAMDVQHGEYSDLEINWSAMLDISSVNIKSSLLLMYPSKITSIQFNVNSSLLMYPSNYKEYQSDCSIQRSHQITRKDAIMILKEKIQYNDSEKLCFDVDPQAQMDTGVPNIVKIFRDIEWYQNKFKAPFHMEDLHL